MAMTPPKAGHAPRPAESPAVIAHLNLGPAVALDVRFCGHGEKAGIAYADFGNGVLADYRRLAGDRCTGRPHKNG
jgi:hypothetical protein